jgi:hypothetical protein
MSDYNGGDIIRTTDGREARVIGHRFRIGQGESSTEYKIRHADGTQELVTPAGIAALVRVGAHDYRPGETRGMCGRCGVRKRDHGTTSTARGMEGKWATPHPERNA